METAARSVVHSSIQVPAGMMVGTLFDAAFGEATPGQRYDCWTDAFTETLKSSAQLVAVSIVTAEMLDRIGSLPEVGEDPQFGMGLIFGALASQPNLRRRLTKLSVFLQEQIGLKDGPEPRSYKRDDGEQPPSNAIHLNTAN